MVQNLYYMFRGMFGNFSNLEWDEIITLSKKILEKFFVLVEQADFCRVAISTSYFYACEYEEGEIFSKYIYEEAKKRNHRSHEEIGLRHHSYHFIKTRKNK